MIPAQQAAKTFRASVSWAWEGLLLLHLMVGRWARPLATGFGGGRWATHSFIPSFIRPLVPSFIQLAITVWSTVLGVDS